MQTQKTDNEYLGDILKQIKKMEVTLKVIAASEKKHNNKKKQLLNEIIDLFEDKNKK